MENTDIVTVEVNANQIPSIIQEQFYGLKALKDNVSEATKKAEFAENSAQAAKEKSARLFHKKEAIESLQEAIVDLADAQISAAQAQEVSFKYQQKIAEISKYLFELGVSNIAVNRSVVRELELKLKGASEEELDEFARQEIIAVVKQLKAQEDIMKKQGDLSEKVKVHETTLRKHEQKDKSQDEEIARQAAKDEELSKQVNQLLESNLEKETQIRELQAVCEKLAKSISENATLIENKESGIVERLSEKASKKSVIISYFVGAAGLIAAVIQFFMYWERW